MQKLIRKVQTFFTGRAEKEVSVAYVGDEPRGYTDADARADNNESLSPEIFKRSEHDISRKDLDKAALDVLYGLKRAGYDAYLVGGSVRDLLLGLKPKDFDVVTNAEPEQIKAVFKRQCRLIGRRFRLAHVTYGRNVIEVATFRGEGDAKPAKKKLFSRKSKQEQTRQVDGTGRLVRDNIYGTIEEDVWRRDFTVNSMYYNIKNFTIVDYAGAMDDIDDGLIRLIGDPEERYREDPVRMIRAIRFSAKLDFDIEEKTEAPIFKLGHLLADVSHARIFEEVLKLFHSGNGVEVLRQLRHYGLLQYLFPQTDALYGTDYCPESLMVEALKSTDSRIRAEKGVNPSFLFAAMLWKPVLKAMEEYADQGFSRQDAMHAAANDVIGFQIKATAIPKRFTAQMREIWSLQFRLGNRFGDKAQRLCELQRFRAAYDFIGVRAAAGETELQALFDWWTEYQEMNPVDKVAFANEVDREKKKRKSPRRNRNPYRKNRSNKAKDSTSET